MLTSVDVDDLRHALGGVVLEAASTATPLPTDLELPDDETLKPITEAVRALLGVLASGERLGGPG